MPTPVSQLGDEAFLNLGVEAATEQLLAEQEQSSTVDADAEAARVAEQEAADAEAARLAEEEAAAAGQDNPEGGNVPPADKVEGQVEDPAAVTVPPVKGEGENGEDVTDPTKGSSPAGSDVPAGDNGTSVPDYKGQYEKIMAPFTANGRKVELRNPEEAVQLMQMGANYTRKMQEIAPHRRVLTMLQNNKLTDEASLSFLIDLKNGNKEAIQKLLKESGIDPRDIDVDSDSTYQGGNHYVSDNQVDFQSTVEELKTTDQGKETIAEALKWDQASIDAVGKDPSILRAIHAQRVSGVYDLVNDEVNRRRVLGAIPANVPYLHAYQLVGNEMAEEERKAKEKATAQPAQPATPIAKTVAQPKAVVQNTDKAKAAGATRSAPTQATPLTGLIGGSDADFMSKFNTQFEGRV